MTTKIYLDSFLRCETKIAFGYEFDRLMKLKNRENRSKMSDLNYSKLELQEYLKLNTMSKEAAQIVFRYRVRMANYGKNFCGGNGPVNCPLCGSHMDGQKMGFENCPVIKSKVQIAGNYKDIFSSQIKSDLARTLQKIDKYREDNIQS